MSREKREHQSNASQLETNVRTRPSLRSSLRALDSEVRNKYGAKSFLALAEKFGGVMAGRICAFFLVLFPVGACLIYMIVIGDVMPPIFAYMGWGALASRPASVALFGCLIILPLVRTSSNH